MKRYIIVLFMVLGLFSCAGSIRQTPTNVEITYLDGGFTRLVDKDYDIVCYSRQLMSTGVGISCIDLMQR